MEALPVSSRAAPTPAARVIELTQQVNRLTEELTDARALLKAATAEDYQRWRSFAGTSFGGVSMAQYWVDLVLWESVLNDNPQLNAIVEIGTWLGGFSWWLDAQARARGLKFLTVDVIPPVHEPPGFLRMDVWREKAHLLDLILPHEPLALFCDGGNKPRELREFGLALRKPDSLVFVHDWGTQTQPTDVPDGLRIAYEGFCDDLGGITRVFRPPAGHVGRE